MSEGIWFDDDIIWYWLRDTNAKSNRDSLGTFEMWVEEEPVRVVKLLEMRNPERYFFELLKKNYTVTKKN